MNRPHQVFLRELVFPSVNTQHHAAFEEGIADGARHHDHATAPLCLPEQAIGIELRDRSWMPRIHKSLRDRAEEKPTSGFYFAFGDRPFVKMPERVANDLAAFVADQLKHARDLQVGHALHQPGEKQHAEDEHNRHQQGENSGTVPDSALIDPCEGEEGVYERGRECPERMKKYVVARKPKHQPREVIALNCTMTKAMANTTPVSAIIPEAAADRQACAEVTDKLNV